MRGAAPGTRETEALRSGRLVQKAHAVLLTGGSAFGLDAAGGVVQYLEEKDVGFPAGPVRVPIVSAAVIFDLGVGDPNVRPDRAMGYQACLNATEEPVETGGVGAGTGATVGKAPGVTASPGGVGSTCVRLESGLIVAAIVVVNALGNVVDPGDRGNPCRRQRKRGFRRHYGTAFRCEWYSSRDKHNDWCCGNQCHARACGSESGCGDGA